jgi:hypothetical protein
VRPIIGSTHPAPAISPDGTTVAFWAPDADNRVKLWVRDFRSPQARALPDTTIDQFGDNGVIRSGRTYVTSVDGGDSRLIVDGGSRAEYAAGRLLYVKDGNLMAQPFDAASLTLSGEPQRVVEKVGALTQQFQMREVQLSETGDGVRVSPPIDLFRAPTVNAGLSRIQYWPTADGKRFLCIERQDAAMPRTINIVLNWPALLGGSAR